MTDSESDARELPSAYLDGEVTAAERARVEGDPELLAEVERLRQVRRAVGEIPVSGAASREGAITAALAAFDESGDNVPAAPPNVVSLADRRKARWMQGLGAAAAAMVVVIGGFAIANRDAGDDGNADDVRSAVLATQADEGPAEFAADTPVTTAVAMPPTATAAVTQPQQTATDFQAAAADQPLAAAPAETAEAEPADAAGAPALEVAAQPAVFRTAAEFRGVAESLTREAQDLGDVVEACESATGSPVPDALFDDDQGDPVAVIVATTADGFAAVSIDTCEIVLRAAA